MEEKVCEFKKYIKQTMDLLNDSYRWKLMAESCDSETMKQKYMTVSNTLLDMFMVEHENMKNIFKQ